MSTIPVKPFKPLPPLTPIDDIRETSIVFEQDSMAAGESMDDLSNQWMPTNRSVALSSDPWHYPLMMMEDEDGDIDMNGYYHSEGRHPFHSVKRVSMDVTETFMDEEDAHAHSLHDHTVLGQDDFGFMVEGLEQDPILAIPGTTTDAMVLDADVIHPSSCQHHTSFLGVENEDDPWIEAAAEAVFEITDDAGMTIFEFDHSSPFSKLQHDQTVGTEESTMASSYSSYNWSPQSQQQQVLNPSSWSEEFQERRQMLAESMRASQLSRQCLSLKEHVKLRANLAQVLKDIESSTATVQHHLQLTEATVDDSCDGATSDMENADTADLSLDAVQEADAEALSVSN
jgi:hypothetical protein